MSFGPRPHPPRLAARALLACGALVAWISACGEPEPEPACLALAPDPCAPLYAPTFDEIHRRLLVPSCALSGGACHAADGGASGLRLDDPDVAYAALAGDPARVRPGDAACSLLYRRLEGQPSFMPPGAPLRADERCVVRLWIEQGAPR